MRFAVAQGFLALVLSLQESRCLGQDVDVKELTGDNKADAKDRRHASLFWYDDEQPQCDFLAASNDACGLTCVALGVNYIGFEHCLNEKFGSVQLEQGMPTLVWPGTKDYNAARSQALNPYKLPAAVVYAKSTDDVKAATKCAYKNGYRVSARGRGHSLQGMGVIDGALTIDMTRMCNPEDFVIDRTAQGPHILPGSRYVATIKAGPGCTNAVMLHSVHKHFPAEEGAMVLIGSCPSVGITGYVLGGGMGDITPYVGYAADLLEELEMVLYNGTCVTASKDKHPDLYWASRGGGGGNGIVTSLTFKVVEAPKTAYEKLRFTQILLNYADAKEAMTRLQDFMYDSKSRSSSKFGGNVGFLDGKLQFTGVYLGHWRDAMRDLRGANLLDEALLDQTTLYHAAYSTLWTNYTEICGGEAACTAEVVPPHGVDIREYISYGEMEARVICRATRLQPNWTNRSRDICADMGLDGKYCYPGTPPLNKAKELPWVDLNCESQVVIEQLLKKSGEPSSFINKHGGPGAPYTISLNGLLLPPLEKKTMRNLGDFNLGFSHLGHGASQLLSPDETAFPWRNAGLLTSNISQAAVNVLLQDKAFKNDVNKIQGYYNYMSPEIPNWRRFYFDQNWERLTKVKGEYDPLDVFGKPMTAELPMVPATKNSLMKWKRSEL